MSKSTDKAKGTGLVGIVLTHKNIIMVEMEGKTEKKLVNYAIGETPKGVIEKSGQIKVDEVESFEKAVKKLIKQNKINHKNKDVGYVVLDSNNILKASTSVSSELDEDEILDFLQDQSSEILSVDIENIYYDFVINKENEETNVVEIVGCDKDYIDDRNELLEACGMNLKLIDYEENAVLTSYTSCISGKGKKSKKPAKKSKSKKKGENVTVDAAEEVSESTSNPYDIVINIKDSSGASYDYDLYVIRDGKVDHMESESKDFSQTTSSNMDFSFGDDIDVGEAGDLDDFESAIKRLLKNKIGEMSSTYETTPDNIFFCGLIPNSSTLKLSALFEPKIEMLNPFKNIKMGPRIGKKNIEEDMGHLVVAAGVALRRFRNGRY